MRRPGRTDSKLGEPGIRRRETGFEPNPPRRPSAAANPLAQSRAPNPESAPQSTLNAVSSPLTFCTIKMPSATTGAALSGLRPARARAANSPVDSFIQCT